MHQQDQNNDGFDPNDLDLVDDRLEDEGKDNAALWSEFDQEEAATDGEDDGRDAGHDDPDAAADLLDEGKDEGAADPGRDGREPLAGGNGESDGRQPSDKPDDIWATATPEQRAAYEAAQREMEIRDRRLRGQVSALQRQYNELVAKQRQPAADQAAGGKSDEPADAYFGSDQWKKFQDDYPEVAGPLKGVIGNLAARNTRLEKELSAIGDERRQAAFDEQEQVLAAEHPDWKQVTAEAGPQFMEWLNTQPRHIQEAAHRNANAIVDAAEAADVIGRFKAYRGQGAAQRQPTQQQPIQLQPQGRGTSNDRLDSRRQQQLKTAAAARSRGPGAASGISETGDPERIWKQFDELERRQARA